MPKRLLDFIYPPAADADIDAMHRWRRAVWLFLVMNTILWVMAFGWGALVGLPLWTGFAHAGDVQRNTAAVEEIKSVIRCGNLQAEITTLRDALYVVDREIAISDAPRDIDLRRRSQLMSELSDTQERFSSLRCQVLLQ